MTHTRRDFVKKVSITMAGASVVGKGLLQPSGYQPVPLGVTVGDPTLREAALRALDAAKAAGATFADVRIGSARSLRLYSSPNRGLGIGIRQDDLLRYSVRVLAGGMWGFVSSDDITPDGTARAAKAAVAQAKVHARGLKKPVELPPVKPAVNVEWKTPVKKDPFTVPINDQANLLVAAKEAALRVKGVTFVYLGLDWTKEERIFVSTDGALVAQTFIRACPYESQCYVGAVSSDTLEGMGLELEMLFPGSGGWEYVTAQRLEEEVEEQCEKAVKLLGAPTVDVGKYDVILSGRNMADPLTETLGSALDLDRALGFEAGTIGTSYAAPPEDILGKLQVGSKLLTVSANRAMPGAAATGWDDEGIQPREYTLIDKGIIVDYNTNRETAQALDWWYKQRGKPNGSNGCACSSNSGAMPITAMPNLSMEPAKGKAGIDDLISGVKKGLIFNAGGWGGSDQQGYSATYRGNIVQEVKNGKIIGHVKDAALQFRTREFWKSMDAIGDASTVHVTGLRQYKGDPYQRFNQTIVAPAARFRNVNVINTGRNL